MAGEPTVIEAAVAAAITALNLDFISRGLARIEAKLDDHEKRIRANEVGLAKLLYVAGGSAGFGGAIVAAVMALMGN